MPKKPLTTLTVDTHIRCRQIYPKETDAAYADLKTVGVRLSREEALHLAAALLAAAQEWREVELVVHRFDRRTSDHTYLLSVVAEHHEIEDPEFVRRIQHKAPAGTELPAELEEHLESLKDQPISD
ncbi:MAG: hypothetical protein ACUVRZ_03860 [Desulfobacca sp.]|uniref:hypothetical protein n=1 Tax=Desulfobacca sp. TaxID=2067990 RepID=UPI004049319A